MSYTMHVIVNMDPAILHAIMGITLCLSDKDNNGGGGGGGSRHHCDPRHALLLAAAAAGDTPVPAIFIISLLHIRTAGSTRGLTDF